MYIHIKSTDFSIMFFFKQMEKTVDTDEQEMW